MKSVFEEIPKMNRRHFMAATAATAALAALPIGAAATTSAEPALHLYECDSSYWVIAASLEEAKQCFIAEEIGQFVAPADDPYDVSTVRQLQDSECFTMCFNEIPENLREAADCQHERDEDGGCTFGKHGCGEEPSAVTLTAEAWSNGGYLFPRRGEVIREYQG